MLYSVGIDADRRCKCPDSHTANYAGPGQRRNDATSRMIAGRQNLSRCRQTPVSMLVRLAEGVGWLVWAVLIFITIVAIVVSEYFIIKKTPSRTNARERPGYAGGGTGPKRLVRPVPLGDVKRSWQTVKECYLTALKSASLPFS